MEYETVDWSHFPLAEVWTEREGEEIFDFTTVTALVDGRAYMGKIQQHMEVVDDIEIMKCLEPVPAENLFPLFPENFMLAIRSKLKEHYLRTPQFTFDDCQPGKTFVADCLLSEATVLERLQHYPHPNIVGYYGCLVDEGGIRKLCLRRYASSLLEWIQSDRT